MIQGRSSRRPGATARIGYLKVQNFKAFRDVEFKDLTPLTVLLGPNGSGSSSQGLPTGPRAST